MNTLIKRVATGIAGAATVVVAGIGGVVPAHAAPAQSAGTQSTQGDDVHVMVEIFEGWFSYQVCHMRGHEFIMSGRARSYRCQPGDAFYALYWVPR